MTIVTLFVTLPRALLAVAVPALVKAGGDDLGLPAFGKREAGPGLVLRPADGGALAGR